LRGAFGRIERGRRPAGRSENFLLGAEEFLRRAGLHLKRARPRGHELPEGQGGDGRVDALAQLLTPEELERHLLRNSGTATMLTYYLRDTAVTEAEYKALFALQRDLEARFVTATSNLGGLGQSQEFLNARFAQHEQARTLLGEDRFATYLAGADFAYGQTANFAKNQPAMTKAATYDLYRLQLEASALNMKFSEQMRTVDRNSPDALRRASEEMQRQQAALRTRLETLVGKPAAEAYLKTPNGSFFGRAPTPTPTPAPAPRG
jgi:FtsZ-binding cell division protein ZapB